MMRNNKVAEAAEKLDRKKKIEKDRSGKQNHRLVIPCEHTTIMS
jgi:hypothetical protein